MCREGEYVLSNVHDKARQPPFQLEHAAALLARQLKAFYIKALLI